MYKNNKNTHGLRDRLKGLLTFRCCWSGMTVSLCGENSDTVCEGPLPGLRYFSVECARSVPLLSFPHGLKTDSAWCCHIAQQCALLRIVSWGTFTCLLCPKRCSVLENLHVEGKQWHVTEYCLKKQGICFLSILEGVWALLGHEKVWSDCTFVTRMLPSWSEPSPASQRGFCTNVPSRPIGRRKQTSLFPSWPTIWACRLSLLLLFGVLVTWKPVL